MEFSLKTYEYDYTKLKSVKEYNSHYELRFEDSSVAYVLKNGFKDKREEDFFKKNVSINKNYPENSRKRKRLKIKQINKEILTNKDSE